MKYYNFPLQVGKIMVGKKADVMDIRMAITQNLRLLFKTMPLRYAFDPSFGSLLNKHQFATPPQQQSVRRWRDAMQDAIQSNLKTLLIEYEPRLKIEDVLVQLEVPQHLLASDRMVGMVLVQVQVIGHLTLGRKEKYRFPDSEVAEDAQEAFPLYIPVGTMI